MRATYLAHVILLDSITFDEWIATYYVLFWNYWFTHVVRECGADLSQLKLRDLIFTIYIHRRTNKYLYLILLFIYSILCSYMFRQFVTIFRERLCAS
jgi:hypothetical protein